MRARRGYDSQGCDTVKALIAGLAIALFLMAMASRMQSAGETFQDKLSAEYENMLTEMVVTTTSVTEALDDLGQSNQSNKEIANCAAGEAEVVVPVLPAEEPPAQSG